MEAALRDRLPSALGSPLSGLFQAVLAPPITSIYSAVVARRNRRFDAGRGVVELDRPVISVGNLSLGGTGKTPMVMHLARALLDAGLSPAIAMRGYRAADGSSDEAQEYRDALPDVPVVAQPHRLEGLIELFGTEQGHAVNAVLLDDGFQHRRIARQFDLVLIDATRPPTTDAPFPRGWLREPLESLRRAHAVIITRADHASPPDLAALTQAIRAIQPDMPIGRATHAWGSLKVASPDSPTDGQGRPDDHAADLPTSWLRGRRVVACCAIGNPDAFLATLRQHVGRDAIDQLILPDHDPYDAPTMRRVVALARASRADALVVTDKDWTKLRRVKRSAWPCPVLRPRLAMDLDAEGRAIIARIVSLAVAAVDDAHAEAQSEALSAAHSDAHADAEPDSEPDPDGDPDAHAPDDTRDEPPDTSQHNSRPG